MQSSETRIAEACLAAYREAEMEPGSRGPVAPLKDLLSAQGLTWSEVDQLSAPSASAYLSRTAGVDLGDEHLPADELAGFLYANAYSGWILVNRRDPLARRRFSVAHELGHYLLHVLPLLEAARRDGREDEVEIREGLALGADEDSPAAAGYFHASGLDAGVMLDSDEAEREADRFAAEVLMPEDEFRRLADLMHERKGIRREALARRLASEMLVSRAAARRRLQDLRLW